MTDTDRITELEIKLTELERVAQDLSDIVKSQADQLIRAEKRIAMLMDRAAAEETQGSVAFTDQPPPHY